LSVKSNEKSVAQGSPSVLRQTELLAPAGSMESLIAAVNAGADAVYLGGPRFGARRSAENFDFAAIEEAVHFCHARNTAVYVTVNTLIKPHEMDAVLRDIERLYHSDVDAVILQDLGVLYEVKKRWPDFPCHASTQMTFHSAEDVAFAKTLGFSRVVLSRELSLDEVKHIAETIDIEIEVFVHGALCVSYSGQCLMSSMIGGRSGNRGACAQPCRKPWKLLEKDGAAPINGAEEVYLMSPKDLNLIHSIRQLPGISLKIEGRMKGADYVYTVVNAYRKVLDESEENPELEAALSRVFNRGFTGGHFSKEPFSTFMNYESSGNRGTALGKSLGVKDGLLKVRLTDRLNKGDEIQYRYAGGSVGTRADQIYLSGKRMESAEPGMTVDVPIKYQVPKGGELYKTFDTEQIKSALSLGKVGIQPLGIKLTFSAAPGEAAVLTASLADATERVKAQTVFSEQLVEEAIRRPLSESRVEEQLSKLGGTVFYLEDLKINLSGDCALPVSAINQMRRDALERLENDYALWHPNRQEKLKQRSEETQRFPKQMTKEAALKKWSGFLYDLKWLDAIEADQADDRALFYYLSYGKLLDESFAETLAIRGIVPVLPRIIRGSEWSAIESWLNAYEKHVGERGMLCISHVGQLRLKDKYPSWTFYADVSVNCMNASADQALKALGVSGVFWSTEAKLEDVPAFGGATLLDRVPLMLSEYCPIGGVLYGHDHCGACLKKEYELMDEKGARYPLRCSPTNCRVEILADKQLYALDLLRQTASTHYRVVIESEKEARQLAEDTFEQHAAFDSTKHTRGNLLRGVE